MTTRFTPRTESPRQLRDAFGRFATGVAIVTTGSNDGPVGMIVNSFSSVSLDPALVLWSADQRSRRFGYFADAGHYAIHVLADDQKFLCDRFGKDPHGFNGLDVEVSPDGVPLLQHCLARFECRKVAVHPGGDHVIIVGEVTEVEMRTGNCLAFFAGQFGAIGAPI